jgi:NAD(P)-dependent dehydrogenase (short-subunit alcohol dehydrogenase family)
MSPDRWSLTGRVAVVVGAGRGLGAGCAAALVEAGARTLLVARSAAEVKTTAASIGGTPHVADVTDPEQIDDIMAAAAALGEASILVNAAGMNRVGPAENYDLGDWDALFAVNVRATFLLCRAFGAALLAGRRHGSIINLSSQMGRVGYPGRAAYCASKHAVEGLTKALAVEWAARGIRVNAVAPTFVRTPLTAPMLEDEAFREDVLRRLPTGELATVREVADAVRYLACDASGSVTGTTLAVDGGWTAW